MRRSRHAAGRGDELRQSQSSPKRRLLISTQGTTAFEEIIIYGSAHSGTHMAVLLSSPGPLPLSLLRNACKKTTNRKTIRIKE